MSYEPTEWKSGDVVSSQKLNKIENGIANAGLVKSVDLIASNQLDDDTVEIDCTWQQLYDWMNAGYFVFAKRAVTLPDGISGVGLRFVYPILAVVNDGVSYTVYVFVLNDPTNPPAVMSFEASASDEHPVYSSSGEPSAH